MGKPRETKPEERAKTGAPDNITTPEGNEPLLPDSFIKIDPEIDLFIRKCTNKLLMNSNLFENSSDIDLFNNYVDNFIEKQNELIEATKNPSSMPTIGQIEEIIYRYREKNNDLDLKMFINSLNKINNKNEIVIQKKTPIESTE